MSKFSLSNGPRLQLLSRDEIESIHLASTKLLEDVGVKVYNDTGEMILPAYVTSRVMPGTVFVLHGGWYKPGKEKSQLMPDGIDMGGAPNFLIHNEDLPLTIVDMFPCKGLVEVKKWDGLA